MKSDIVETKWVVITGAPSSGKTTLVNELVSMGYKSIPDIARLVIESGGKIDKDSPEEIQRKIVNKYIEVSNVLDPKELIIFDYGMPDNIVFQKLLGLNIESANIYCEIFRYAIVFICEPLPFKRDGLRDKDEGNQNLLYKMIWDSYKSFGYEALHIPIGTISQRLNIIRQKLENL